jgi:hypothetical protein
VQISRHRFTFRNLTAESNTEPYHNSREPWIFSYNAEGEGRRIADALEHFEPLPESYAGQFYRFYQALKEGTDLPVTYKVLMCFGHCLSPKRTQVRLKSLLHRVWLRPDPLRARGRPSGKSAVCGLNGFLPTLRVGALHLNPRPRSALLLLRPLSAGRFASLRFRPKNMAHHIFQLERELQYIPEAAPEASPSFSVSEKLARYGSSALSGVEHLTLIVGKEPFQSVSQPPMAAASRNC